MTDADIIIEMVDHSRRKPRCHILVSDFANIVKAFMGSNYLSIAYAFKQSGLVIGIIGLLVIATVTDHCCDLIVKCKYQAIQLVLDQHLAPASSLAAKKSETTLKQFENSVDESEEIRKESLEISRHLTRSLTYGDIGKIACGSFGLFIVNACVIFTQFGFCVGYFIFVGNTVFSLFSSTNTSLISNGTELTLMSLTSLAAGEISSSYHTEDVKAKLTNTFNYSGLVQISDSSQGMSESLPPTPVTDSPVPYMVTSSRYVSISEAPDLRLLVISPLPIFVCFALLRNIRHLGFVSVGADLSLLLGCVITLVYIVIGFELSSSWEMFDWTTFPVFFGMVTSSYEGIGTIIPIESSMEGNRHNFSKFLHGAVLILTSVLTVFGIMGYLQNGESTEQMLNKHIPASDGTGMAINIFLCVGVILTFPLQIYPVIELTEIFMFRQGAICGSKKIVSSNDDSDVWERSNEDKTALLPKKELVLPAPVALTVTDEVSAWKRNLLRLFVVLFAAGIAVLMRDLFAYVSAFIGAIGSSLLAYVLPCLFHLRLCWHKLGYGIRAKDIFIIAFGTVASVASLYTTVLEVVKKI